jgi:hypothetical protein
MNKMVNGVTIELTPEEVTQRNAEVALAEAEFAATGYISQRQAAYPPIEDYIDGIVKGDNTQVQTYVDACLAVKAQYPKP